MNAGKQFEQDFRKSIPDDVFYYRLRDGTATYYGGMDNDNGIRFQQTNICDVILYDGRLFMLELKTHKGKSIPLSCIKEHQLNELSQISGKFDTIHAGFIFNMCDCIETYFVYADAVDLFILTGDRKSIPIAWMRDMGIKINQEQKRIHYRYDISGFLEKIE